MESYSEPSVEIQAPRFAPQKALDTQVGGGHYKDLPIQPVEYCQKNKLDYCESNVVKYISRWRDKGGIEDLRKVQHYVELLIQIEGLED